LLLDEFVTFTDYCKNLKFEENPNYDILRDLLNKIITRHGLQIDYKYDWVLDNSNINSNFNSDSDSNSKIVYG
jgi:hypothetical protein